MTEKEAIEKLADWHDCDIATAKRRYFRALVALHGDCLRIGEMDIRFAQSCLHALVAGLGEQRGKEENDGEK